MKWFKNLRIRPKLLICFAIVIAFAIVLATMAISTLSRINSSYAYLINFPEKRLQYLLEIDTDCATLRRTLTAISMNAADPETVESNWKEFEQSYDAAINFVNKYIENNNADTVRDPVVLSENNDVMHNILKQFETYRVGVEKGLATVRATGDRDASYAIFLESAPIMAEISSTVNDSLPKATAYTEQVRDSNTQDTNTAIITFIILLAVIVVLSVLIAIYISGLISKPLLKMRKVMDQVGNKGNLGFDGGVKKDLDKEATGKDEIAQSIAASIKTIQYLEMIDVVLQRVADGDLTSEFEVLSDKDTVGLSILKMLDNLNNMFSGLRTASGQVSAGSAQVSQAAQSLASGSTEQAASIEEFSASLTELEDRTKNNAHNAAMAREANEKAATQLTDSGRSMDDLLEAMKSIDESSSSITKVIKVIDDIAFQTNILALNAAVEAARAGNHGKGFAVVAEEVRNLASKSADAAKETAALIEGSSERVKEGNQLVAKTNESLGMVLEYAQELGRRVGEVDTASAEQASAIIEIRQGIEQISTVVQANSATAEQSAAAAQEMSAQATLLDESVAKFKLRQEAAHNTLIPDRFDAPRSYKQPEENSFALSYGKY